MVSLIMWMLLVVESGSDSYEESPFRILKEYDFDRLFRRE